jgi:hypothetical protein
MDYFVHMKVLKAFEKLVEKEVTERFRHWSHTSQITTWYEI